MKWYVYFALAGTIVPIMHTKIAAYLPLNKETASVKI